MGEGRAEILLTGKRGSYNTDGVNNAEEVFVERCDIASCNVSGRLRFDHFGEVDSGVEMRAEVGLLSRNVVIRGEMESSCYPPNPCEEVTYDTFGGHIIAKYDCKQVLDL